MDKSSFYKPYDELYKLIEKADILRDHLNKAKEAKTYDELHKCLMDASDIVEDISIDISNAQELSSKMNFSRKESLRPNEIDVNDDDDDEDDEYEQNFVNALNNFIKAHR